jgi:hypothetical protein
MKKSIKVISLSLLSLSVILIAAICVAIFLVFTPERFTPIVRRQADKLLKCQSQIGQVELTFFSTFPDFGIKISSFILFNPGTNPDSDTLASAEEFVGTIDVAAWWKNDELIIKGLKLTNGSLNLFSDSLGNTNYNVLATDTASTRENEKETELPVIELRNVEFDNVDLHYTDLSAKLEAVIRDLSARIAGTVRNNSVSGEIEVKKSVISVGYDNEKYLDNAVVSLDLPANLDLSRQTLMFKNARVAVNDLGLMLNGSVENDTLNKRLITDINFQFASWPVEKVLAMVPGSYTRYLRDFSVEGQISSDGSVRGIFADSVMPMMNLHLKVSKGDLKYSGLALPLHDIDADVNILTDLKNDTISNIKVNRFSFRTPRSVIRTEGFVDHLFTDTRCKLSTNAVLNLNELNPLIPDSMKIRLSGRISGKIESSFSLSQVEKLQFEKMKLSGSMTCVDLDASWDSLALKTDRSKIDFSLPNNRFAGTKTKFALVSVLGSNISFSKTESFNTALQNAALNLQMSDPRDTSRIPDVTCDFTFDSLSAGMDTISIYISKPSGKATLFPQPGKPGQPGIIMAYKSGQLNATIGHNSASLGEISFNTEIFNDKDQNDIFLQWLVSGFADLHQCTLNLSGLAHPINIPSLRMKFDPEMFNIEEGNIRIDRSDFSLTGDLTNILSYFRGDSLLRGNFSFNSGTTDIAELMALTSGIGQKDSTHANKTDPQNSNTSYTGPYMVPEGMDLVLNTRIKRATLGTDTASNIRGSVKVHDGIMVLDGLTFDTPAARMQLTAIYRTPRKNHLFLGLDYHLLNVEIGELLEMIPDIDTLMPMLRSFKGKGEFHIAVETYLDSLYNIKKSTLRGASSIRGNDLVLMDGETFSEIAKTLRFNKKTENRVDSLSAEFTIFRNEIDVYPFLIVLDKYKAVIAGRHNFDMSFDYHISVVDSPLPIKLGIDIKGNEDDLSYRLAKCRYAEFYRPSSRHEVENKQLELRKLIRDALTQKVKE